MNGEGMSRLAYQFQSLPHMPHASTAIQPPAAGRSVTEICRTSSWRDAPRMAAREDNTDVVTMSDGEPGSEHQKPHEPGARRATE